MPNPIVGLAGASVVSGIMSADAQESAAETAAHAQTESNASAIAEQRRQFNVVQELLRPYVTAGTGAIGAMQPFAGIGTAEAQQQAIASAEASPEFQAMLRQGENAILANASATGGLRGGGVQEALATFRPALLADVLNARYGRLGDLASLGQASAAGQAQLGGQTSSNISNLMASTGSAIGNAALAAGQGQANAWQGAGSNISQGLMIQSILNNRGGGGGGGGGGGLFGGLFGGSGNYSASSGNGFGGFGE